jgi:tetratricopeptide (TPR) repeat protein
MGKKSRKKKTKAQAIPSQGVEKQNREYLFLSKKHFWLASALAAALTFIVFLPALNNDFVNWDDHRFVYENKRITSIDIDFFKWAFTNKRMQWSPLRFFSHAIDYKIWKLNPLGHHLTNIILHSLDTFLVVLLVFALFKVVKSKTVPSPTVEEDMRFQRKALITGVVTGLLFGLHPLHVESVAWVSERKDVLYTFFYLLSLMLYLKYVSPLYKTKKKYYYFLCLLCFTMALMSKAMAVTLPLVLIILDVYPLERLRFPFSFKSQRNVLLEKLPFIGLSIAAAFIAVSVHEEMGAITSFSKTPLTDRILVLFKSLSFYLMKMAWPSQLAPFHPYPHPKTISFFSPDYASGFILLLAITAFCIFLWRKGYKIWLVVWAYFIITLLPVLGIIKVGGYFAAERYTYMPSIGPFLLAGLGISLLWEKTYRDRLFFLNRKIIVLALIFIVSVMSVLTIKQIKVWKNSITLFNLQLKTYPKISFGYSGRGKAYADIGDYKRALDDLEISIKYNPNNTFAYKTRANVYIALGDYQKAIEDLDKAVKAKPLFSEGYGNRCGVYIELKDFQRAIEDCSKAIETDPANAMAYNNRGFAHFSKGDLEKALRDYSKAIELDPMNPGFYRNRGTLYVKEGKKDKAISDFQKAAKLGDEQAQDLLKKIGKKW